MAEISCKICKFIILLILFQIDRKGSKIMKKRHGLDLGGVREPLLNLTEADQAVVDKAAAMIEAAVQKYV